jgi:hypothetical protein
MDTLRLLYLYIFKLIYRILTQCRSRFWLNTLKGQSLSQIAKYFAIYYERPRHSHIYYGNWKKIGRVVSRDFRPPVFFIKQYSLGPWFWILLRICRDMVWSSFRCKKKCNWHRMHENVLLGSPFLFIYYYSGGVRTICELIGFRMIFPLKTAKAVRIVRRLWTHIENFYFLREFELICKNALSS